MFRLQILNSGGGGISNHHFVIAKLRYVLEDVAFEGGENDGEFMKYR